MTEQRNAANRQELERDRDSWREVAEVHATAARAERKRGDRLEAALRTLGVTAEDDIDRLTRGLRPGTAGWLASKLGVQS